jgi:hypothetical protein
MKLSLDNPENDQRLAHNRIGDFFPHFTGCGERARSFDCGSGSSKEERRRQGSPPLRMTAF